MLCLKPVRNTHGPTHAHCHFHREGGESNNKQRKKNQLYADTSDYEVETKREREGERLPPMGACKMCEHLGPVHARLSIKKGKAQTPTAQAASPP